MKNFTKSTKLLRLLFVAIFMLTSFSIYSSHFRYMTVNWEIVSTGPGGTVVEFNVTQSWRSSFNYAFRPGSQSGPVTALGQLKFTGDFQFGDGTSIPLIINVNNINTAEDFFVGNATFTHTYTGTTDIQARFASCCRIFGLGPNSSDDYDMRTTVTLSDLTNTSPVANTPPIYFVPVNQINNIQLSAFDPDGDALSYLFATSAESGLTQPIPTPPNGQATLNSTGLLSIDTNGVPVDTRYATQVIISDSKGATIPLDFIIQTIGSSTPPQFSYPPTPTNLSVINVGQGNTASFGLEATDADLGDNVTIFATGLPTGASFSNTQGNPANASFSWTPTASDLGAYVIAFTAQDDVFAQANTSVTINVVPCSIDASASVSDVSCIGESDGSIDLFLTGNFGNPTYSWTGPNGFTSNSQNISGLSEGTYMVVATGDFGLGCSVSKTYTIGLEPDVTSPIVETQDISVQLDIFGEASITASQVDDGSTDNCGIASLSLDQMMFDANDLGQNTVTLTVTDTSGNINSGTAVVTVTGTAPPSSLSFQQIFSSIGLASGSVAFADVDNDNDQDVIVTGALKVSPLGVANPVLSRIFLNDGDGDFGQDNGNSLIGLLHSSVSFVDVNNDDELDIISTGELISNGNNINRFYSNDGSGNFSLITNLQFPLLDRKDFKYADFDNDAEDELLIIGLNNSGQPVAKIYDGINNGSLSAQVINLVGVTSSSIDVADIDGDNDVDIFISGNNNGVPVSSLYTNEGNMNFNLVMGTPFEGVDSGDSDFVDIDNDGDMDLVISGINANEDNIFKVYLNDGNGIYAEEVGVFNISPNQLIEAFEFADIDGDNDKDVLIMGYDTNDFDTFVNIWENQLLSAFASRGSNSINNSDFSMDLNEMKLNLYPNPVSQSLYIESSETIYSYSILDINGKLLMNQKTYNDYVPVEELSNGVYVIRLQLSNNQTVIRKFVKK